MVRRFLSRDVALSEARAKQTPGLPVLRPRGSMKAGSRGGTVVYQVLVNAARSVLMLAKDLEDPSGNWF